MISVAQAQKIVIEKASLLPRTLVPVSKSRQRYLAEAINAPISLPPFRQSAMDGYAFIYEEGITSLTLAGKVQAGATKVPQLKKGEAIRIFTGAPVPDAANTVIIQEHTQFEDQILHLQKLPAKGANIRPVGEQVTEGVKVLEQGHAINEASIGFLAGLGITEVSVYSLPKVAVLMTGDELQEPGTPLEPNQIYESNGIMLKNALARLGIIEVTLVKAKDTFKETKNSIAQALETHDVLLVSGGISVGDYDFVQEALKANSVTEHFYKVNQKPGKPLWFGTKDSKSVFGLPGNPASSLTAFYVYVLPHLRARMGSLSPFLPTRKARLTEAVKNPFGKTLFLKAGVTDETITPYTGQASSMLNTYALSNALLVVEEDQEMLEKGQQVGYIDLNF